MHSPRTHSRSFSFRSDKSGGSKGKDDLTESPKDKQRRDSIWKATSKANPNAAMNEAQPGGTFFCHLHPPSLGLGSAVIIAMAVISQSSKGSLANAYPEVNAILEENTLTPLRGVQHKDVYGNIISMYSAVVFKRNTC